MSPSMKLPTQDISVRMEVHFHTQDQASVFIEDNVVSSQERNFAEIYTFVLYTLRQLATLDEPETGMLAEALLNVAPIIGDIAAVSKLGGVEVVQYPGYQGRKVLFARLDLTQQNESFYFNIEGFDSSCTGIAYYSPASVFGLLRFLARKHANDSDYLVELSQAAEVCAKVFNNDQLTMENQTKVAKSIIGMLLENVDNQNQEGTMGFFKNFSNAMSGDTLHWTSTHNPVLKEIWERTEKIGNSSTFQKLVVISSLTVEKLIFPKEGSPPSQHTT